MFQENIILCISQNKKDKRGRTIDMMKCKFYSEEICKCLFDGPPDDCPFDNKETCNCFEPIEDKIKSMEVDGIKFKREK